MLRPWVEVAERSGRAGEVVPLAAEPVRLEAADAEPVRLEVADVAVRPAARLVARPALAAGGWSPADAAVRAGEAVFFAGLRGERDDSGIRPVCSFAGWPQDATHHVVTAARYRLVI
ncbi:MAG: hypothetical protein IRY85_19715 [Micromonosporaceae bacterium]|nr:hypothetical protein [Micromonosporaceae bacterium]